MFRTASAGRSRPLLLRWFDRFARDMGARRDTGAAEAAGGIYGRRRQIRRSAACRSVRPTPACSATPAESAMRRGCRQSVPIPRRPPIPAPAIAAPRPTMLAGRRARQGRLSICHADRRGRRTAREARRRSESKFTGICRGCWRVWSALDGGTGRPGPWVGCPHAGRAWFAVGWEPATGLPSWPCDRSVARVRPGRARNAAAALQASRNSVLSTASLLLRNLDQLESPDQSRVI